MLKNLKEMFFSICEIVLDYMKHRLFPVTVVFVLLFSILIRRLFVLQIVEGREHMENFVYKSEKTLTIDSVRGRIYDCNGKLLAYNDLSHAVVFSTDSNEQNIARSRGISVNELRNTVLYQTIQVLQKNGDELSYDFPVIIDKNKKYQFTVEGTQLKNFYKNVYAVTDFELLSKEEKSGGAEHLMDYLLNDTFEISDSYTKDMRLKICACRYKLWMNRYQQYMPVTIAYDISDESAAYLTEHGDELSGIDVTVKSLRRYNDAKYFAHIIGYVGGISEYEMNQLNDNLTSGEKYTGTEMVGKMGIEQYCEDDLRGTTGKETMYVDNLGRVLEVIESTAPTAGNDVYLTIDSDLQKYCYDTLEKEIASILLAQISPGNVSAQEENAKIPITDVYFGLFNNNYISIEKMAEEEASTLERRVYNQVVESRAETLKNIERILRKDHTVVGGLDMYYQDYMQYICEILSKTDIMDTSKIDHESEEYLKYTNDETSLYDYLMYAISCEAIDINALEAVSDYYDNDEIYGLLVDYIVTYLESDNEFSKKIVHSLIITGAITGNDVVNLIYLQGVLPEENDLEYQSFKDGSIGAYEYMLEKIRLVQITPAMLALKPCSGSIVVTDCKTGDVKAMVSYPGYDNNRLTNEVDADYYNTLLNDKTSPMLNRATQVQTAPGSTYKVMSAVTGLTEGVITEDSYVNCSGEFMEIDPPPKCWVYPAMHGGLDVKAAIQHSCNVFFYTVGYRLSFIEENRYKDAYGLERLAKYATEFGLNDLSGVEIAENKPHISDKDAVRSSIGQGTNLYAPVQLSRYVTTIANSGTCYNLTLIDKITDYEGSLVRDNSATVLNTMNDIAPETWDIVHEGMRRVVSINTNPRELIRRVDVDVAGKSGTAQQNEKLPDHALFISYAPYENPEVTVTSVIQFGYASGNASEVTGFIYAYMYDQQKLVGAEMQGNNKTTD